MFIPYVSRDRFVYPGWTEITRRHGSRRSCARPTRDLRDDVRVCENRTTNRFALLIERLVQ